jgi:hypothetical protein
MVAEYFTSVQKFVQQILSIGRDLEDTEMDAWDRIYLKMGDVPSLEADWLQHLANIIRGISGYLKQIQQWLNHLGRICTNVRLERHQRAQVLYRKASLLPFIEEQDFTLDYLHWVVSDAMTELSALVDQSEELTPSINLLLESIEILQCEHLKNITMIFEGFSVNYRFDVYRSFNQTLVLAYKSQDIGHIKRLLSMYFDLFSIIRVTKPLLLGSDSEPTEFDAIELQKQVDLFDIVTKSESKIGELMALRPKIYYNFIKHEVFILSSLLPKGTDFANWLRELHTQPKRDALTLFPTKYDSGLLRLGIQQGIEQLHEILEHTTLIRSILDDESLKLLLGYLRSSPLDQFYNAEVERMKLFFEYLEPLIKQLEEIQTILNT